MTSTIGKDWKALSEAASREQDPHKLLEIVRELNRALDEREQQQKERHNRQSELSNRPRTKLAESYLAA
jgi:hypothetical protein